MLGFVLQGDPSAQESIRNSVLGQFPIIGKQTPGQAARRSHDRARDRPDRGAVGRASASPRRPRTRSTRCGRFRSRSVRTSCASACAGFAFVASLGDPVPDLVGRLRTGDRRPRWARGQGRRDRPLAVAQLLHVRRRFPAADGCQRGDQVPVDRRRDRSSDVGDPADPRRRLRQPRRPARQQHVWPVRDS